MKPALLFLILVAFLGELLLDGSTAFVRCLDNSPPKLVQVRSTSRGGGGQEEPAAKSKHIAVIGAAHAALPVRTLPHPFWQAFDVEQIFADFLIPCLNPPSDRIERPPIV